MITGFPPKDQRGKHGNRPNSLSEATVEKIKNHIKSYKGRVSHYALHDSTRIYLPATLSLSKMHKNFQEINPDLKVSYETYRKIFNTKFNIGFGHPRKDTCSTCDKFHCEINHLRSKISSNQDVEETARLLQDAEAAKEKHLQEAEVFYERKRNARARSLKN